MGWFTLILFAIAAYAIHRYYKKKLNFFKDLGVPCLPAWPILGSLTPIFFQKKFINDVMQDIYNCNKEAKYVGAFNFGTPTFVIRDLELVRSIAIKDFDSFPDHVNIFDEKLDPLFGSNLFTMAGERWKEARHLLSPAFATSKMKSTFDLIVATANNSLAYLDSLKKEERVMVNSKDFFTRYANDVIASYAFGVEVDSLKNPKNDFYVFGRRGANFEGISLILKFILSGVAPFLLKWFNITYVAKDVRKYLTNVVESTVAMRDENNIRRPDILQLMMDARHKDVKTLKLDPTEMTAISFVFYLGGFETTSNQLSIIAHELAINPNVQQRLQKEIDDIISENGDHFTYEMLKNMPYLDAVFNESLRLHTQFNILGRVCIKSFKLPPALPGGKPVTIEPGMHVWIPGPSIHRDTKHYEKPEAFDPDRYYRKKVLVNDPINLAFGIGPRMCIGYRFATMETKILIFLLLSKYSFIANERTVSPFKYDNTSIILIKPINGFWISIQSRERNE